MPLSRFGISGPQSRLWAVLCVLVSCVVAMGQTASAQALVGTRAGTPITNVASLRYDVAGTTTTLQSNETTLIVAERLDLQLSREGQGSVVVRTDPTPVPFTLTNGDNGDESFVLTTSVTPGTITVRAIAIDTDGDGLYDPARDTVLADGVTPVLTPGQSIRLLAILSAGDGTLGADGSLSVTARAATGSGVTGRSFDGMGDGGGDAIVGQTGATATIVVPLRTTIAGPVLIKSQSVRAADGSTNAVRDAVVTYTLEARFVSALADARIDDPVPAGTAYVPGSLTLDGAPLSDAADADAGGFAGNAISVALSGIAANSVRTVTFKAKIQ